jgi:hypothetical protein
MQSSNHGTLGVLLVAGNQFGYTMEPPWRNNKINLSCIPTGEYRVVWHYSPKYGWCYLVTDVQGRSYVLFHPGNYGGDITQGFKTDTHGCILVGKKRGWLNGQRVVLASRTAIQQLFLKLNKQSFNLTIIGENSHVRAAG